MSADNTIGVLATMRRDGQKGLEYRVAETQAIECAFEGADYPPQKPVLHRESVLSVWGKSRVFFSAEDAFHAAAEMETHTPILEYGIVYYDRRKVFFPASDSKLRQRRRCANRLAQQPAA